MKKIICSLTRIDSYQTSLSLCEWWDIYLVLDVLASMFDLKDMFKAIAIVFCGYIL